eukprot:UN17045
MLFDFESTEKTRKSVTVLIDFRFATRFNQSNHFVKQKDFHSLQCLPNKGLYKAEVV